MNLVFRIFLAFNSTSLILVVYWIKSEVFLHFGPPCFYSFLKYISYCFYVLLMIVLTGLSLLIAQWLDKGDLKKGQVINVEYANDAFLPSYLGYTFVALDVPNAQTLYFVYGIIFVFTFLSQALYFNPVFLLYGYRFYNVTTANNVRVFLISKKKIKIPNDVNIESLLVINNFTYLDNEEK